MPAVTFIHPNRETRVIEAGEGDSVMLTAMVNSVEGILGDCGGCAVCGTCHVYVDQAWIGRLPACDANEDDLLDSVAAPRLPQSRLACRIELTAALDGLIVYVPERQV
jgi:ferredoxin, 2Fe-2S